MQPCPCLSSLCQGRDTGHSCRGSTHDMLPLHTSIWAGQRDDDMKSANRLKSRSDNLTQKTRATRQSMISL